MDEHTCDEQRVFPHVLRRDEGDGEEVAVTTVPDAQGVGVEALVVPVSEEIAYGLIRRVAPEYEYEGEGEHEGEGLEAHAVTLEEIKQLCAEYGIATVGLYGLEDSLGLNVHSVETLALVLEPCGEESG
jgi:hypothetical protein